MQLAPESRGPGDQRWLRSQESTRDSQGWPDPGASAWGSAWTLRCRELLRKGAPTNSMSATGPELRPDARQPHGREPQQVTAVDVFPGSAGPAVRGGRSSRQPTRYLATEAERSPSRQGTRSGASALQQPRQFALSESARRQAGGSAPLPAARASTTSGRLGPAGMGSEPLA